MPNPEFIVQYLQGQPGRRATDKQLLRDLKIRGKERGALKAALTALRHQGRIIERRHTYELVPEPTSSPAPRVPRAASRDIQGRITVHRDGYAFVTPAPALASGADIFIPPPAVNGAMQGDIVAVQIVRKRDQPAAGDRLEGRVTSVVKRAQTTLVGTFHTGPRGNYVQPFDERIRERVQIPSGAEVPPADATANPHRVLGNPRSAELGRQGSPVRREHERVPALPAGPAPSEVLRSAELGRQGSPVRREHERVPALPAGTAPSEVLRSAELGRQGSPVRREHERVPALPAGPAPIEVTAPARHVAPSDGEIVEIEVTRFPTPTAPAQGRVLEILGRRDDFGVDVEIIIRKHHLPHHFPPAVLAEAAALKASPPPPEPGRRDFRALPIVTIDGESARDFDDAVLVTRTPEGNFDLQVHIADVSHYVAMGSAIDQEAQLRGTSVYFPDRAVPMLPQELSTDLCSLRPREDRLVMSCLMTIDPHGEVLRYELTPGIICSAARMTYTQVHAVLQNDPAVSAEFSHLADGFRRMAELQAILYAKRQRRGSIDFDLPEPEIAFDDHGLMRSIVKSERNLAHRLIEEFMLICAETVAKHIQSSGRASVYRIHEQPDLKKVAEFEDLAATFGYSLGLGPLPIKKTTIRGRTVDIPQPGKFKIHPRNYQKLAARIAGTTEERMLSFLMLRSLKQARYSAHNVGHFALAAACYTHFTSPIRRYPDLMVHRILKALLQEQPAPESLATADLIEPVAAQSSDTERRADDAERELMDWKKVRFMEQRLGEQFHALIIHVTRQGFFVELEDLFIEGFVPATSLDDDDYRFLSTTNEWIATRSKRKFKLGARLDVLVDRIDPVRNQIHFAPVAAGAPSRPARSPRRRRER